MIVVGGDGGIGWLSEAYDFSLEDGDFLGPLDLDQLAKQFMAEQLMPAGGRLKPGWNPDNTPEGPAPLDKLFTPIEGEGNEQLGRCAACGEVGLHACKGEARDQLKAEAGHLRRQRDNWEHEAGQLRVERDQWRGTARRHQEHADRLGDRYGDLIAVVQGVVQELRALVACGISIPSPRLDSIADTLEAQLEAKDAGDDTATSDPLCEMCNGSGRIGFQGGEVTCDRCEGDGARRYFIKLQKRTLDQQLIQLRALVHSMEQRLQKLEANDDGDKPKATCSKCGGTGPIFGCPGPLIPCPDCGYQGEPPDWKVHEIGDDADVEASTTIHAQVHSWAGVPPNMKKDAAGRCPYCGGPGVPVHGERCQLCGYHVQEDGGPSLFDRIGDIGRDRAIFQAVDDLEKQVRQLQAQQAEAAQFHDLRMVQEAHLQKAEQQLEGYKKRTNTRLNKLERALEDVDRYSARLRNLERHDGKQHLHLTERMNELEGRLDKQETPPRFAGYDMTRDRRMKIPVAQLEIGDDGIATRIENMFINQKIETVGQLLDYGRRELLKVENFGRKSVDRLAEALEIIGLTVPPMRGCVSCPYFLDFCTVKPPCCPNKDCTPTNGDDAEESEEPPCES